ncbi:hypothetical protein [Parafilimonas terrae]|uniref:Uncharacterized protein n=1 Tax=Parafilimonas terrae TaxID=1465490 RepID=A0A1I5XA99_9BACT|nr:hypothetical protein [Parafilimonas terrae]SFQ28890.1 hypothetical protein SAMN05444277_10846 [Parafilimonas terrae]
MTKLFTQIRILIIIFIIVLLLSGITVFPLISELKFLLGIHFFEEGSIIQQWLLKVVAGLEITQKEYPFIFYGFDWLAFAHIVIAFLFIGVYQHPVRNRWIIQWAIITCICIFPLAFIAGGIRGIPFFHILIDCSFGVVGLIVLFFIQNRIKELKKYRTSGKAGH